MCTDKFRCRDDTVEDCSSKRCAQMIDAGVLTCAIDFCASCGNNAGDCDVTCDFCATDGGGKSGGLGGPGGGKRLLQAGDDAAAPLVALLLAGQAAGQDIHGVTEVVQVRGSTS